MSNIRSYLTLALPFACGAATKYAFHRPPFGKSGVVLLGVGALHAGAGFFVPFATAVLTDTIAIKALEKTKLSYQTRKYIQDFYVPGTLVLGPLVYAVASKAILGRLKIPTSYKEALVAVAIANIAMWCAILLQPDKENSTES